MTISHILGRFPDIITHASFLARHRFIINSLGIHFCSIQVWPDCTCLFSYVFYRRETLLHKLMENNTNNIVFHSLSCTDWLLYQKCFEDKLYPKIKDNYSVLQTNWKQINMCVKLFKKRCYWTDSCNVADENT